MDRIYHEDLVCLREGRDLLRVGQEQSGHRTATQSAMARKHFDAAIRIAGRRMVRQDDLGEELFRLEIDLKLRAAILTPTGDTSLVLRLLVVADTLVEHSQTCGSNTENLNKAIEVVQEVGMLIDVSDPYISDFLLIHGRAYRALFEAIEEKSATLLNTAIENLDKFQNIVMFNAELLQLEGSIFLLRFRHAGNPQDLNRGIQNAEAVLAMRPNVSVDAQIYALVNIVESQPLLFDLRKQEFPDHLNSAVDKGQEAKDLASSKECTIGDTAFVYGALSLAQYRRYQQHHRADDLTEAIQNGTQAVDFCKHSDSDRAKWVNNLGLGYIAGFRRSADLSELQRAIRLFEEAVTLSHNESKIQRLGLANLADALALTFEWTGDAEALDIAVSKYRELANIEIPNQVEWGNNLQNLGNTLRTAYNRYFKLGILNEAMHVLTRALEKYPEGHADIDMTRILLCDVLIMRYRDSTSRQESESGIELAIDYGTQSLSTVSAESPHFALLQNTLSKAYFVYWDGGGRQIQEKLTRAIEHSEEGLNLTYLHDLDRASYLVDHSNLLLAKVFADGTDGSLSSFDQPLGLLKEATHLTNGPPLTRIAASRKAIRILGQQNKWEEAKSLGLAAMQLLPLACGRHLSLQDQQEAVSQTSGLASEICSLLIKLGHVEEALQQLEAGRAMLLSFAMNDSDEVRSLEASTMHKGLAKRFKEICSKLRLPSNLQSSRLGELKLRERRAAEAEFSSCLQEIRALDGYEGFLCEPSLDILKSCSRDGLVIVVNVSYISSDAIILVASDVRTVPLVELQLTKAVDFGIQLISGFSIVDFPVQRAAKIISIQVPNRSRQQTPGYPDWLWMCCVRPIFDNLGILEAWREHRNPVRIWWVGSGAAAGFPFHAAASESEKGHDALSMSISSYTPSIKALLHSRMLSNRFRLFQDTGNQTKLNLAIITMETTPGGHLALPGVREEKEVIRNLAIGKWNCIDLPQPTASQALEVISQSSIVHFACHGLVDRRDPSQSHLVLERTADDDSAKEVDKLTVSQLLVWENINMAWIAFLSACSTGTMGTFRLGDEGLHMSGALQIAGFPHVVGTLWKVEDRIGVKVARWFYQSLINTEPHAFTDSTVATALREAVLRVKEQSPTSWTDWAAYIHFGV